MPVFMCDGPRSARWGPRFCQIEQVPSDMKSRAAAAAVKGWHTVRWALATMVVILYTLPVSWALTTTVVILFESPVSWALATIVVILLKLTVSRALTGAVTLFRTICESEVRRFHLL